MKEIEPEAYFLLIVAAIIYSLIFYVKLTKRYYSIPRIDNKTKNIKITESIFTNMSLPELLLNILIKNFDRIPKNLLLILNQNKKYIKNKNCVYKLCLDRYFVIMNKSNNNNNGIIYTNENRKNIVDVRFAKCRADRLFVMKIIDTYDLKTHESIVNRFGNNHTRYTMGKNVYPDKYDKNKKNICSHGIHYFKNPLAAFYWRADYTKREELWIEWSENGKLLRAYPHML